MFLLCTFEAADKRILRQILILRKIEKEIERKAVAEDCWNYLNYLKLEASRSHRYPVGPATKNRPENRKEATWGVDGEAEQGRQKAIVASVTVQRTMQWMQRNERCRLLRECFFPKFSSSICRKRSILDHLPRERDYDYSIEIPLPSCYSSINSIYHFFNRGNKSKWPYMSRR